jgi:hypothetical protein
MCKTTIFLLGFETEQEDGGVLPAALSNGVAGASGHRVLRGEGKTERRLRGTQGRAHLGGERRQASWRRTAMATGGGPKWWRCFGVIPGTRCGGGASAWRGGAFRGVGYDRGGPGGGKQWPASSARRRSAADDFSARRKARRGAGRRRLEHTGGSGAA